MGGSWRNSLLKDELGEEDGKDEGKKKEKKGERERRGRRIKRRNEDWYNEEGKRRRVKAPRSSGGISGF